MEIATSSCTSYAGAFRRVFGELTRQKLKAGFKVVAQ